MADQQQKDSSEQINIKVQGQDGAIIHFKIKKNTQLKKLMSAYCERLGLRMNAVRFIFDGNNIEEKDTPTSLDMEENDTIEVFQTQTGGVKISQQTAEIRMEYGDIYDKAAPKPRKRLKMEGKIYTDWPSNDEEDYRFVSSRLQDYNDNGMLYDGPLTENPQYSSVERYVDTNNLSDPRFDAPPIYSHYRSSNANQHTAYASHHETGGPSYYKQNRTNPPPNANDNPHPPAYNYRRRGQFSHEDVPPLHELSRSSSRDPTAPRAASLDIDLRSDKEDDDDAMHFTAKPPPMTWYSPSHRGEQGMNLPTSHPVKPHQQWNPQEPGIPQRVSVDSGGDVGPAPPRITYESMYNKRRDKQRKHQPNQLHGGSSKVDIIDSYALEKKFPLGPTHPSNLPPAEDYAKERYFSSAETKMPQNIVSTDRDWDLIEEAFQAQLRLRRASRNSVDEGSRNHAFGSNHFHHHHHNNSKHKHTRSFSHDKNPPPSHNAVITAKHPAAPHNGKELSSYSILPPIGRTTTTTSHSSEMSQRHTEQQEGYEAHFLQDRHPELRPSRYRPYTIRDFHKLNTMDKLGGLGADLHTLEYQKKKEMRDRRREYGDKMMQRARDRPVKAKSRPSKQKDTGHGNNEEEVMVIMNTRESPPPPPPFPPMSSSNAAAVEMNLLRNYEAKDMVEEQQQEEAEERNAEVVKPVKSISFKLEEGQNSNTLEMRSKRDVMLQYSKSLQQPARNSKAGVHNGSKHGKNPSANDGDLENKTKKKKPEKVIDSEDLDRLVFRHEEERRKMEQIHESILY